MNFQKNDHIPAENEPLQGFQQSLWRKPYTAFSA